MIEFESASGRTGGDLIDLALATRALLLAARAGDFNRTSARGLICGGHVQALVGQVECEWLEVKSQPWNLNVAAGKAEAAKDVSAFANARGGILVVPARTSMEDGKEVITRATDMPMNRFSETQFRDVLARWTYPPVRNVEVDVVVTAPGRCVVAISIDQHRQEDWPHFVVGDDQSAFPAAAVSAHVRDGDQNRALTAPELHALTRRPRTVD